jgi:hypothetical protein
MYTAITGIFFGRFFLGSLSERTSIPVVGLLTIPSEPSGRPPCTT